MPPPTGVDMSRLHPSHAGGVVYKLEDGQPRYLIETAKNKRAHWVLPKGHIEAGETPEKAAEREVAEETGIRARVVAPVGVISFRKATERVQVEFFLLHDAGEQHPRSPEGRTVRWCSLEEALRLLTFAGTREILRKASVLVGF